MTQDSHASFHNFAKFRPFYGAESSKFSVQLQTPCSGKLILSPAMGVIAYLDLNFDQGAFKYPVNLAQSV